MSKYIRIPADASFTVQGPEGPVELPLVFKKILIELMDTAANFGTRQAQRKSVFMEKKINEAEIFIPLEDDEWTLINVAINGDGVQYKPFSWITKAAKIMERAGWFAAIEEATSECPEKGPKIVTRNAVNSEEKPNA